MPISGTQFTQSYAKWREGKLIQRKAVEKYHESKCLTRTHKNQVILHGLIKMKIRLIFLFNSYNNFQPQVVWLVFLKLRLNILIWEFFVVFLIRI